MSSTNQILLKALLSLNDKDVVVSVFFYGQRLSKLKKNRKKYDGSSLVILGHVLIQ